MRRWRRTAVAVLTAAGLVTSFAPPATAAPVDLKQNNSDAVTSGFACAGQDTTALRRYDLDGDHGITLPFTVSSATFGAWIVGFPDAHTSTATVTISTIPDDDTTLAFADLTPIGTADVELSSTNSHQFVLRSTDVEATVVDPTATDLVLAVTFVRDGVEIESGPGTNTDGETKPTYIASCNANPTISLLTDNIPGVYVPMWVTGEEATDTDSDGVADDTDNCVDEPNEDQANIDNDALGDVCDDDDDNDSILDGADNCPVDANSDQANIDSDEFGDACDADIDGDDVANGTDNCVNDANADQSNLDNDAFGDVCDSDDDGDTVGDGDDNCPTESNLDQADNDGDGPGDACDDDDDNDLVLDNADNCVNDANADQANLDGDELGDECDGDDDGDTIEDGVDNCVNDANADQANHDEDPLGDACDDDDDGDTVLDEADACDILPGNPARPKAEGCPSVARSLTAHFANGDIAGAVESEALQCVANVPVVVSWRKNDGTMKRRTTTTNASGDFSVHSGPVKPDGAHHWFFWVRAPAVLVEDVGLCSFTTLRDPDTRIN